jgi:hypothetical protein
LDKEISEFKKGSGEKICLNKLLVVYTAAEFRQPETHTAKWLVREPNFYEVETFIDKINLQIIPCI